MRLIWSTYYFDLPWVDLIWSTYYSDKIPRASDPCSSFWWHDVMKLSPTFRGITGIQIKEGLNALFWKDMCCDEILTEKYPRALSFAKEEDISVRNFLASSTLGTIFHIPLSIQAYEEVRSLQLETASVAINSNNESHDVWTYAWGADDYNTSQYYRFYFREVQAHLAYKWLWKSNYTMKIKVFGWLLMSD